jgi:UDP-N-acetylglucosamine 4,6-dehydratase
VEHGKVSGHAAGLIGSSYHGRGDLGLTIRGGRRYKPRLFRVSPAESSVRGNTPGEEADVKAMLITGATGSLGSELVARYYGNYDIYAHGRDAQRLLKLQMRFPRIRLVLGDLRCHGLQEALRCCRVVIHAAAQKYVDLAEKHCQYTVDTNVVCTHDLADQAARAGVERFVFISTDKSSAPNNVYGITKYLAERLVLELSDVHAETSFVICRFGNIFGSNGSVVQLWLDAMRRNHGMLRVTDPDMTRFMFSLEEAADTVTFALTEAASGDIIIPKMHSVCLRDIIALFPGARVQVVGKRPGEKMHETLYVKGEINTGYETDRYFVLNRRSPRVLMMDQIDSSQVGRVDPERLQGWFERVQRQAA